MKNWKTTVAGVITVVVIALHTFYPTVVTSEVTMQITALLVSLGLVAAKDNNVTGV
jgi:hypothetical protein